MSSALALLSAVAVARARRAARDVAVGGALVIVAALLAIGAIGCAAGVVWLALRPELGAMGAWGVLGAGLLGSSLLLVVGSTVWRNRSRRAAHRVAATVPDLRSVMRRNEWPLIAAGLLVGFLSGLHRRR
jgi:hypothetical protein